MTVIIYNNGNKSLNNDMNTNNNQDAKKSENNAGNDKVLNIIFAILLLPTLPVILPIGLLLILRDGHDLPFKVYDYFKDQNDLTKKISDQAGKI